jgi:hypothetical protein
LNALDLGGVGLDEPLAVAGEIPQLPDGRRGHEAASQQPMLEQLRQPGGIGHVGLAAGQDLDLTGVDQHERQPRSSSTCHTGFQYWPVASITTWVTASVASQSASASSPDVKVG